MSQQERFTQALERLDAVVAQAEDRIAAAAPGERPREEARLSEALSKLDALLPAEARDKELTAPPSEAGIYAAQNAAVAMEHVARVGEGRIRGAVEGSGISSDTLMARLREGAPKASLEQDWLMDDLRSVAEYHGFDLTKQGDLDRALEEVDRVHDRIGDDVGLDLTPEQREGLEEKTSQKIEETITARDPVTNELVETQGRRRTWETHDIQRGTGAATDAGAGTEHEAGSASSSTRFAAKHDLAKLPAPTDAKRAEAYREAVEARLTPAEIARLKQGDISGLEGVGSREDQLSVAREYLKAEGNSPQALRQVSDAWFDERAANAAQERGLEHD